MSTEKAPEAVVTTGASGGIGRAMVRAHAGLGANTPRPHSAAPTISGRSGFTPSTH